MKVASRVVALLLMLGMYGLVLGLGAGVAGGLVYALRHGAALEVVVAAASGVLALLLLGGAALLWRTRRRDSRPGIALPLRQHPALWAEVHRLAAAVGTRAPDEIRLVPQVNAAVIERTRLLGLVSGSRTMLVGAPLLMGFTRGQLRAVLAHELAHYSHRHTRLGAVTYRGRESIDRLLDGFGERTLAGRAFSTYGRLYTNVTHAASRQQELEADDFSVSVAGRDVAASALSELSVVDAAWHHFSEHFLTPVHASGHRPEDLFLGFAEVLEAPGLRHDFAGLRTTPEEAPRGRHDCHPPVAERVARIRSQAPVDVPEDDGSALMLLGEPEEDLRDLQEWMYRDSGLTSAPWSRLLHGHESSDVRTRATALYDAARQLEGADLSVGAIVASVEHGRLAGYVRPHLADPSTGAVTRWSRDLLTGAVQEALMSCTHARFSLTWDGTRQLTDRRGRSYAGLDALVREAVSSGDPEPLGEWLIHAGVPLGYVPEGLGTDPRERVLTAPAAVLEALAPIRGNRHLFCVVLTHGVVLRRPRLGDRLAGALRLGRSGQALLRRVRRIPGAELIADPQSTWLPWHEIASLRLGSEGRHPRPTLVFTAVDGTVHTVKYRPATRDTGKTLHVVKFFLGHRVTG